MNSCPRCIIACPSSSNPARADLWLEGNDDIVANATEACPRLKAWPVDRRVNNARNEGEDLVEPDGEVLEG